MVKAFICGILVHIVWAGFRALFGVDGNRIHAIRRLTAFHVTANYFSQPTEMGFPFLHWPQPPNGKDLQVQAIAR